MQLSGADGKNIYKWLSADSSAAVSADESTESAELSDFSKKDRTAYDRKRHADKIDLIWDDIEDEEKVVPVNPIKCHNVEMTLLGGERVSKKKVVRNMEKIVTKREKEKSSFMQA